MKRSQELFEEIEGYLSGTLAKEAAKAFEERMAQDSDLQAEVALHASLHKELKNSKEIEFRDLLNTIATEKDTRPKKGFFPWKVAASIALLVAAGFYFYMNSSNDTNLYEEFFSPYPVEDQMRGAHDAQRDAALKLYADAAYEEAAKELQPLLKNGGNDVQLQLYYGTSLLQLNKVEEAVVLFENIPSASARYETAQWYLAMAYLKKEDFPASQQVLNGLVAFDGIFKDRAMAVLEALD